jgi:HSP20 family protein
MYVIKVRLDPSLRGVQNKMQKLMGEMMNIRRPLLYASDSGWTPESDMYETENEVFLVVNLAGVRKEDIEVAFDENYLRIGGKRIRTLPAGKLARYHQLEMGHGDFERIFRLPALIDQDRIEASYAEGLLTVRMNKRKKSERVYVEIKS